MIAEVARWLADNLWAFVIAILSSFMPAHPYLQGNRAPIQDELNLTPCVVSGTIPRELREGMYVRNGGNPKPVVGDKAAADYHLYASARLTTQV